MRRIIAFIVIFLIFISLFCFYFFGPEYPRLLLWDLFERDVIYLKNGVVVHGWIWEQTGELIIGESEDKTIFNIHPSEYRDISNDEFLHYLYELL